MVQHNNLKTVGGEKLSSCLFVVCICLNLISMKTFLFYRIITEASGEHPLMMYSQLSHSIFFLSAQNEKD